MPFNMYFHYSDSLQIQECVIIHKVAVIVLPLLAIDRNNMHFIATCGSMSGVKFPCGT